MRIIALQSGSNGNCVFVESRGVRLLFDAGISGKQAQQRLAGFDRDITDVDALIISHDHADHSRCMGIYQRKFGLPIYASLKTFEAAAGRISLGQIDRVNYFRPGATLRFDGVAVETIPTPHDGADGVAFVVDDGRSRLGILTDLGHAFDGLDKVVRSLDAVLLESNYDPTMLDDGEYPEFLKRRIRGPGGHLSNHEAAALLRQTANGRMKWACLAHLSEDNNHPEIALRTHQEMLGQTLPLSVASRYRATELSPI